MPGESPAASPDGPGEGRQGGLPTDGLWKYAVRIPASLRTRELIAATAILQTILLVLVVLQIQGFGFFLFRQLIGALCLLYLPGSLFLRCVGVRTKHPADHMAYTVVLSMALIMFGGFLTTMVASAVGRPEMTLVGMAVGLTAILAVLCGGAWMIDRRSSRERDFARKIVTFRPRELLEIPVLIAILMPLMATLGGLAITFYDTFVIIHFLVILWIVYTATHLYLRHIPGRYHLLFLYSMGVSLMLQGSMVSLFPQFGNVDHEFEVTLKILETGSTDPMLYARQRLTPLLSIPILLPTMSLILNVDLVWLGKLWFAPISTLILVFLHRLYARQFGEDLAFFGMIILMFNVYFFQGSAVVRRQQIAFLMLIMMMYAGFDTNLHRYQRTILGIIGGCGVVVAHYTVSYSALILFSLAVPAFLFMRALIRIIPEKWDRFMAPVIDTAAYRAWLRRRPSVLLGGTFVMLYTIFLIIWNIYSGDGRLFERVVDLAARAILNADSALDPNARSPTVQKALGGRLDQAPSPWNARFRISFLIVQAQVIIGFLYTLLQPRKFNVDFVPLGIGATGFLGLLVASPTVAAGVSSTRTFFFALMILAPMGAHAGSAVAAGGRKFVLLGDRMMRWTIRWKTPKAVTWLARQDRFAPPVRAFFVFAVVGNFIFTVGLAGYWLGVTEENRRDLSIPTSYWYAYRVDDVPFYSTPEIIGMMFFSQHVAEHVVLHVDNKLGTALATMFHSFTTRARNTENLMPGAFFLLRDWNIEHEQVTLASTRGSTEHFQMYPPPLKDFSPHENPINDYTGRSKIYINDKTAILWTHVTVPEPSERYPAP